MKRNSQELLLGESARMNRRFCETRLAAAIALGMALVSAPCLTQAQDASTDAAAASSPEQAAKAPANAAKHDKAAKPDNVSDLTAITVTGIRASLMSAQSLKQNADQIIDSVTATDINALPDRSVTETLQRISGVTVDHFLADDDPNHPAAEGSGVLIRSLLPLGLIDELLLLVHPVVLGDGRRLFEPDGNVVPLRLLGVSTSPSGVVIASYGGGAAEVV